MGYYSQLYFDLIGAKVDKEKLARVREYFSNWNDGVSGFYGVDFEINEDNNLLSIVLEDYYAKFYDDEVFAKKLSDAIIEGEIILSFYGEDGEQWKYRITKKKVDELHALWFTSDEIQKIINYLQGN